MSSWADRMRHPREGWVSLLLLAVMAISLAWSVQGAAWLERMDFLVPLALASVIAGAALALTPWSVVATLPIAAILGTLLVVRSVGGEYLPGLEAGDQLLGLRGELVSFTAVLVRTGYPGEMSPYALGLGALMWTTGFIAAYTVYRHHKVLDAILLVGILLVANMSATFTDLFRHLVIFAGAALLLWLRAALVSRQQSWQRRRVNENLEVPASIMRSGILFAGGSIAMAWILTGVAVAAPLTDAWRNLDVVWSGITERVEGAFGGLSNSQSRLPGISFGSGFVVSGNFVSSEQEVMIVASDRPYYMRTRAYDEYTGRGFRHSDAASRRVDAGAPLFPAGTPEQPRSSDAFVLETVAVELIDAAGRNIFAPGFPVVIYAPTIVHEVGGAAMVAGLEAASPIAAGQGYQVTAAISNATEAQLAGAGSDYPPEITAMYLDTTGMTERTAALAGDIVQRANATEPYSQAKALATYLQRDPSFEYATRAAVPDPGEDFVDFFLFDADDGRRGYCEYYASAMALMARSLGIPARVAVGYAPGERRDDGTFLVRQGNAHAWAELYFPGYGWQIFEATKTINPQFVRRSGGPASTPVLDDSGLFDPADFERNLGDNDVPTFESFRPVDGGFDASSGGPPGGQTTPGGLLVIVAAAVAALLFAWTRLRRTARRLRMLPRGERPWQQLAVAAGRAGVGPRPSETIYEYAAWLEDQIPDRRPEIWTLADGKVYQSYSGRTMGSGAIARIEAAWRRLRIPILTLAVRRRIRNFLKRS